MASFPSTGLSTFLRRLATAAGLLVLVSAPPAAAQLAPQGATTVLRGGVVRGVDASFDPSTNTYMVVGAQDAVFAVCTNAAGAATTGEIVIKPASGNKPFGSFPRVQYSQALNGGAGAFLVIWQQEEAVGVPQLYTRVVSCTQGLLGTEKVISTGVFPWTDFGASALAYSPTGGNFLVAWKGWVTGLGWRMVGRLVDLTGAGVGEIVTFSTGFGRDPGVAWNPFLNEFGVSFSGESADGRDGYSIFVRMPANNIAAFSRTTFNSVPGCMMTVTDLAYNPDTRRYLMAWWQGCGTASKVAEIDEAGNVVTLGLVSSTLGSYDALSLAYNPISRTFTLLGIERVSDHAMATELNIRGFKFAGEIRVEGDPPPGIISYTPVRYPRVATHASDRTWLAALNLSSFVRTASQILATGTSNGGPEGSYPPPGGQTCTYSLDPPAATVAVGGGAGSFTVNTTTGCTWTASTASAWIHLTGSTTGSGLGTVSYSVDANAGPARSGAIIAGGQTFTITQGSNCTYAINPTGTGAVSADGATGSFTVTTAAACPWTASPTAAWIRVTSGGSGTGPGTVSYSIDANLGPARSGAITAGGQSFAVTQNALVLPPGCITVPVQAMPPNPSGVGGVEPMWQSSGVSLIAGRQVTVLGLGSWTDAGVTLTAAGHPSVTVSGTNVPYPPGAPLLSLIGRVGTGAPILIGTRTTFTPSANGVLYLAPQDNWYTTWDNAGSLSVPVCPAATPTCAYALSPLSSGTIAAGGGSGSFTVSTESGCSWTAATTASWIRITAGSGTGSGTVTYTVDLNTGAARTGTITVADKTYTVSQASGSGIVCTTASVLASPPPLPGVGGVEPMWQSTGVTLTAGQAVVITASGTWSDAGVALTAAGHPSVTVSGTNSPYPAGAPLLSLIGRIGPAGAPFLIGASSSFTPTASGVLYLAPQDNWYTLWDNAGSLSVSVCQAAAGCTYALSPTSSGTIAAGGGSGSFTVTTGATCAWTPATTSSWVHITSGSGPASGTVGYTVDVNPAAARTGTITVADKTYTVSQAANSAAVCTTAAVVASPVPPPGVGGVEPMWQSTGAMLTAGQPVVITATGTWSDAGVVLTAAGHPSTTVSGTNSPYPPGAPLLSLIGRIGPSGAPFLIGTTMSFTPAASGVLYLAPQDNWYTLWDNAGSLSVSICVGAGGSCSYTLSPTSSGSIPAGGGSGSFTVMTETGCAWSAVASASWIRVTSGSGPSSGTVNYVVDANPGGARSGTITVADKIYTVSQAATTTTCATASVVASPVAPPGVGGVEPMWQSTGVTLTAGQPVTITASGTWSDAGVMLTAAGHPSVTVAGTNSPYPAGAPLLSLIGRIGPGGAPFLIGASSSFTPAASGVLYLAPQDNWYTLWDNAGSLSVSICQSTGGGCTYTLSPTGSGTIPAGGGGGSFTVTTGTGCAWTAATTDSWIHVTSGSGSASGTVTYTVDANPGAARAGTITVADKTYAVSQAGSSGAVCTTAPVVASPVAPPGVGGVEPMWQSTGVTLTAGQPVTITASGTWSDAGVVLTAAGHPSVTVAGTNSPYQPGAPLLSLIGRIGPAGAPFLVGTTMSFTPAATGVLYLAPQDNWYTLWDNAGSVSVQVCR